MVLANFHDRSATAASQIMQKFDLRAFERTLERRLIGVAFDESVLRSKEGQTTVELAVNLLARLYPRLAIIPLGEGAHATQRKLTALARSINPNIEIVSAQQNLAACLVVGDTKVSKRWSPIYLGSQGWIARLSSSTPVGSGVSANPFGAAAAACFGAANAFRIIFAANLANPERDDDISLSLLDQAPDSAAPENAPLNAVDLGEVHLIGVGAIGNAAVWTLARLPRLTGRLHLVDQEKVELTNLQRYVLTTQKSVDESKVEIAGRLLKRSRFDPRTHSLTWADYLVERNDWNLDHVAVALDTPRDRIAVQASLPRYVVNSWTQPGDLGISRHGFVDKNACLACLYMPERVSKNEDEIIAQALGWTGDVKEIRRRLQLGEPTDRAFIETIATARNVPVEPLLQFEGESLRSFYVQAICGGALFHLSKGKQTGPALVPMAFQSALAGVMLAAEIVARALGLPRPPETKTTLDLLRPLTPILVEPRGKAPLGNCICQDDEYVAVWKAKYEVKNDTGSMRERS